MAVKDCEIYAIDLLSRREHSQMELKRKLNAKKFLEDEIEVVLEDLRRRGLQSDQRFAESYVRMRIGKGYGPIRVSLELKERGIKDDLISSTLQEYASQWHELAEKARHKKFGSSKPTKFSAAYQKQAQFLIYRGFSSAQASAALKTEL